MTNNPATDSQGSQPTPIILPAQIFAKLSPHAYLSTHLNSTKGPHRPSGRKPSQSRPPACHTGSLSHANGSAVVRCGDTAVVCGIRAEILKVDDVVDYTPKIPTAEGGDENETSGFEPEHRRRRRRDDAEEMARLNLLVPNIELATGCSPAHLPGGPPSPLAQTLTQRILTLLHTSQLISMDDLRIWSQPASPAQSILKSTTEMEVDEAELASKPQVKAFWTLYISLLFLSLSGPAFDPAWFALLAALKTTRLPKAWYDTDSDQVLCSPLLSESKLFPLDEDDITVPLSFGVFYDVSEGKDKKQASKGGRRWILADLDGFEEGLCREEGIVVVRGQGRVVEIKKNGGTGVGRGEMSALVRLAGVRREEWMSVFRGL
ncbi:hypothetical protein ACLMJK_001053 [Lecanora helva]